MLRRLSTLVLAAAALTALAAGPAVAAAGDKDCEDFATQEDAQAYFVSKGGSPANNVDRLDRDRDGVACEDRPHGSSSGPAGDDGTAGDGGEDELPVTGASSDLPLAIAAGALLSAGGVLVWRLRYQPSH